MIEKTGQLYSIDKKEEKAPNLTWAILPASFLLRNIYSEATAPQVASVPIRIFYFVFDCSLRF